MLKFAIMATVAVVAGLAADIANARPQAVYEDRHHSEVGTFDQHLSKLCSMRLFNQKSQYRHSAYFGVARVLLGAATGSGWNLNDPTGARRLGLDYWFRNDGFSNCEVYHSVNRDRAQNTGIRSGARRR